MRACRYLNVDFCAALGITFNPIIEQWAVIADAAETEARQKIEEERMKGMFG